MHYCAILVARVCVIKEKEKERERIQMKQKSSLYIQVHCILFIISNSNENDFKFCWCFFFGIRVPIWKKKYYKMDIAIRFRKINSVQWDIVLVFFIVLEKPQKCRNCLSHSWYEHGNVANRNIDSIDWMGKLSHILASGYVVVWCALWMTMKCDHFQCDWFF